jgi:hypothetical protein
MKTFSQLIKKEFKSILLHFFRFKKSHISAIGQICDLRNLTIQQLQNNGVSMDMQILEKNEDFFRVQLDDSYTRYILIFSSDGKFHHIQEEYWKDLDVKFEN